MSLFATSDIHLSLGEDKQMDIFRGWEHYTERLEANWNRVVAADDTVVIGGDISWAMKLTETVTDFTFLENLNGKKIIVKGNHDLWWDTMKKMTAFLQEKNFSSLQILHNNAYACGDFALCGTRGWFFEAGSGDEKILNREAMRLDRSLCEGEKLGLEPIVFLHYPPIYADTRCDTILAVLKAHAVRRCFYGHIHSSGAHRAFQGVEDGICYRMLSCDSNNFTPVLIEK